MPDDIPALERSITDNRIGLMIVDPFLGFPSASVDSHKDQSLREPLHELKRLAERAGCVVLTLRYLSKGSGGGNALYRRLCSIAITAAACSTFTVSKHPDRPAGQAGGGID